VTSVVMDRPQRSLVIRRGAVVARSGELAHEGVLSGA